MVENILTLDIEDWCQSAPDVFGPYTAGTRPPVMPTARVVGNTARLLDLLGAFGARATCFVLGSVAEAYPEVVRRIHADGHEVATHGYGHRPVYTLTSAQFAADVRRSIHILQDLTGMPVLGHRAPYFSVTRRAAWALDVLADIGLQYDASIFPVRRSLYRFPGWDGWHDGERYPHALHLNGRTLLELPSTTLRVAGQNLPVAGGAFLRVLPLWVFRRAIAEANRAGFPAIFYLHPHDLDADELRHPLPHETVRMRLLRYVLNVGRPRNEGMARRLLRLYRFCSAREWLASIGQAVPYAPLPAIEVGSESMV